MTKKKDLKGMIFNRWTVINEAENDKFQKGRWNCKCECGNKKIVSQSSLSKGASESCGCLHKKRVSSHGLSRHPLYRIIIGMIQRCYNPKDTGYHNYGGREIKVFEKWKHNKESFVKWALEHGWEKGLVIDRINGDGNYEPSNVRFITIAGNSANKRKQPNNTTGYTGILQRKYHKKNNTYACRLSINGVEKQLGVFKSKKEALKIRNQFIIDNNLYHAIQEYKGEE